MSCDPSGIGNLGETAMKFRNNALPMLLAAALVSAGSIACAQEGAAPRMMTSSVDSDAESVIARSTFWTGECTARHGTVTIKQSPAHGTVSVNEGLNTVRENPRFGAAGKCVGKQIMGKQIVYRSKPGFHGDDTVTYEILSDKGERASTIVNVKVR
jgi:hypothetical protein